MTAITNDDIKKYLNLFESTSTPPTRNDLDFEETVDKVIARLKSYDSAVYTKLGNKLLKLQALEEEVKTLKAELKADTKVYISDLFTAEQAAKTRVIETVSFIFTLSKDPKATVTTKYVEVLKELAGHLTPQLLAIMEQLKTQYQSVTQKSPSLKVFKKVKESVARVDEDNMDEYFRVFKELVLEWGDKYDSKLQKLKDMV